jgi:hypothetical protein
MLDVVKLRPFHKHLSSAGGLMMKRDAVALLLICGLVAGAGWAQKTERKAKPWTEWSRKEADKMLSDSPWAKTQVVNDASTILPASVSAPGGTSGRRSRSVAVDQGVPLNFHICLLSAKPIRQAWARRIELRQKPSEDFKQQLLKFVETGSDEWITIGVTFDSTERQISESVLQVLNNATTDGLRDNTYLELKDGKRLLLDAYRNPARDLLGARFRFRRIVEDRPFVSPESGELRFHSELFQNLILNARFKVADFTYEGVFEY